MNSLELLARSIAIAVAISCVAYLLLKFIAAKRLNRIDAIRAQSLASIDALRSRKLQTDTQKEIENLCADVMNYVMTAKSKTAAEEYLRTVEKVIGTDNKDLIEESHRIVRERFSTKEPAETVAANC